MRPGSAIAYIASQFVQEQIMTGGEQAFLGLVIATMLFFGINLALVTRHTMRGK